MSDHGHLRENRRNHPWQERRRHMPRSRIAAPRAAYCVWVNGELVPYEEATVHILNPTMHYAPGVFEGIRCYQTKRGPAIFRLRDHLERFLDAVDTLGIQDLRYDLHDLQHAANVTVHANNFRSCYIRPVLYVSEAQHEEGRIPEPVTAVAAWEWPALANRDKGNVGMRVTVSSLQRLAPGAGLPEERRSREYITFTQARDMARRAGFDDVIMFGPAGHVAEYAGENIFVVDDGVIYTSVGGNGPEAITRDTAITLARELGNRVVEGALTREHLSGADEIFICGTAAEIVPVVEIDNRPVGVGRPGPVTRALQLLYADTVRGRGGQEHGWLEYVMMEPLY